MSLPYTCICIFILIQYIKIQLTAHQFILATRAVTDPVTELPTRPSVPAQHLITSSTLWACRYFTNAINVFVMERARKLTTITLFMYKPGHSWLHLLHYHNPKPVTDDIKSNIPQPASSAPLEQSTTPSQICCLETHWLSPFEMPHLNPPTHLVGAVVTQMDSSTTVNQDKL